MNIAGSFVSFEPQIGVALDMPNLAHYNIVDNIIRNFEVPKIDRVTPRQGRYASFRAGRSIGYRPFDQLPALIIVEGQVVAKFSNQHLEMVLLGAARQVLLKVLE